MKNDTNDWICILGLLLNYRHEHSLVVPHHGGKAGKLIYKLPMQVRPKLAIISVGKNHFHHSDEKNVTELQNLGLK